MCGVYFVGVDLAWGDNQRTGLCALTANGVVASTRLRSLNDIAAWIQPYLDGDVLVAIDAPLIVRNPTGRRDCEALLGRCFARHEAGAHPANLSRPHFADGGRGAALVKQLGLTTDPHFLPRQSVRRALEVYPHTALVALFGLDRSLKYKAKTGRTTASRQAVFASAVALLESLATRKPALDLSGSPPWQALRTEISTATTGSALDAAEDEFDAYICAYIAHYYWTHGESRCRVIGDNDTGYILTPVTAEQAACLDALSAPQSGTSTPSSRRHLESDQPAP